MQAAFFDVAAHHFFQARLINRENALMQVIDFFLVNVDKGYLDTD